MFDIVISDILISNYFLQIKEERKLSAKTGLPLHYLDVIWHLPDRTTLSREEFVKRLQGIMSRDKWIIDGNYMYTLPMRLNRCDTVFFFDLPLDLCLAGAEERLGKRCEDMSWIDNEMPPESYQRQHCIPSRR